MQSLIFVTLAYPGRPISKTLLLLASLRNYGGDLSEHPVWVFYPESLGEFTGKDLAQIQKLGARLFPFSADQALLNFPLGAKVLAAAEAEKMAAGRTELLVCLDEDTLVLSEADEFVLSPGKAFGFRPVHHKLLGTSWGEDLDEFWQLVYLHSGAGFENDFRMITHAGEEIRPYFNAGSFVVRPERGLLGSWWENFQSGYQSTPFKSFYEQDPLYAVFIHQAVLTGTVLGMFEGSELQRLSNWINYPLHLHQEIPEDLRVMRVDDLLTARYEDVFERSGWENDLPFSADLANWIQSQLDHFNP